VSGWTGVKELGSDAARTNRFKCGVFDLTGRGTARVEVNDEFAVDKYVPNLLMQQ
jgi:hypothetical protein